MLLMKLCLQLAGLWRECQIYDPIPSTINKNPTKGQKGETTLWYEGLLQLSAWETVLVLAVMTHVSILSVSIYLHRYSSHHAFDMHPGLEHFFRFWLWITTGMVTKEWTALHRKHHAYCEQPEDPHSPKHKGLKNLFSRGAELYREEADNQETIDRYGHRCPDDWLERNIYTPHSTVGIMLLLLIDVALFGVLGITVWALQMMWVPFAAAGVINGIAHTYGYRNFECRDNARNIFPWGFIIGGEELHNNHHTYPNAAKLSMRKWEFDIGWVWISLFQKLGLVKVKFKQPLACRIEGKTNIDRDTLLAIVNNRFKIMAQYQKTVIAPLVKYEYDRVKGSERELLRRARILLSRELSLLEQGQLRSIENIVESREVLRVIYEKRLALQAIWEKIKNSNERIDALNEWCRQAEESGIHALQEFSKHLKSYSLPVAQPVK